ncbi:tyrosine-protein kinase family protein [Runella sp.]|jgi:capsular exopolysaccharide synthesis family protein|uniref:GumC family protein n=1 Tax=Runella sp. TaxID=1960881 RepID=UPI002619B483|nr:tyrosine-protein kinase family protein [Runella sp.]
MQNVNWNKTQDRHTEISADIDIKRIFKVLWSRWYWVVGALVLTLGGCFIFLQIANPRYVADVVLRYNEKQTELDELNQLIQPDAAAQEYLTERFVIQSEEVINSAIKKLNYPFTFYQESTFRREDVYPYQPFTAQIISYDAGKYRYGLFEIKKNGIITYKTEDETEVLKFDLSKDTLVSVTGLSFSINSVERLSQDYLFIYNDLNEIRSSLDDQIHVAEEEQNLPILNVSFTYNNQRFTQDFLQRLIESYEEYNLGQKKRSSNLTINFIQEQIKIYSSALQKASSQLEIYKQRKSVPNLQVSMNDVIGQMTSFETQKNTLEIQKAYINLLEQSLTNRFEPINVGSIGLDVNSDGVLLKLVGDLNRLILDRKAFIIGKNLSVNNPVVKAADDEIERIREQILSNIQVQRQKNESTLNIINRNLSLLKSRMNTLPSVERELGYLQNDRDVNEKIYLLLINKEIETSIVKAGMLPSFTVLNRTYAYKIYPQGVRIFMVCLILGLIVGVGSIFLVRFLNNKFTEITKIGQNERVNLLGLIQRYPEKIHNNEKDLLRFLENRSLFSESINSIRTNLSFLADTADNKGKLLVITSELSGEGKSFVTLNLATSLTKVGKKVLIVGSDLRRSKIHRFFNNNNKVGLSSYLAGKVDDYQKIVQHSVIERLDYITSGPVPFNPTELIQNKRFENLINNAQNQYDYVLVDTAPIGLVSDNIPLLKKSDLVIFIIRWLYSSKEAYLLADQMTEEFNLKSVGVIVNDFYKDDLYATLAPASYYASKGYGYSYKYGYNYYGKSGSYYGEDDNKLSFWQKIIRRRRKDSK